MNKLIAESKDVSKNTIFISHIAYVAVGKLSRKIPSNIASDISVVHNFFSALEIVIYDSDRKIYYDDILKLLFNVGGCRHKNAHTGSSRIDD